MREQPSEPLQVKVVHLSVVEELRGDVGVYDGEETLLKQWKA